MSRPLLAARSRLAEMHSAAQLASASMARPRQLATLACLDSRALRLASNATTRPTPTASLCRHLHGDRFSDSREKTSSFREPRREEGRYAQRSTTGRYPAAVRHSDDRFASSRDFAIGNRGSDKATGRFTDERRSSVRNSSKRASVSGNIADLRTRERTSPGRHSPEHRSSSGRSSEHRSSATLSDKSAEEPSSERRSPEASSWDLRLRSLRPEDRNVGERRKEARSAPTSRPSESTSPIKERPNRDKVTRFSEYPKGNADYDEKYALEVEPRAEERATFDMFKKFQLESDLVIRIMRAFPHIREPTPVQSAFFAAMENPSDILMAAHTSTGKSLAVLISLLKKHRNLLCKIRESVAGGTQEQQSIASILVVPSRELAFQYYDWVSSIIPESLHAGLPDVVQVISKSTGETASAALDRLQARPPRILIATPDVLAEMLLHGRAVSVLNLSKLRTLALDEADLLFKLPYRFPKHKAIWKHMKHLPPTLSIMNSILKLRCTYSSGESMPFAGLEIDEPDVGSVVPALSKRAAHKGRRHMLKYRFSQQARDKEATRDYASENQLIAAPERTADRQPLQLIVFSATVNDVMRHFLGARTGWLRTGLRDDKRAETGKWIDFTGLSPGVKKADELNGKSPMPEEGMRYVSRMPRGIEHYCVVVDAPAAKWADASQPTAEEAANEELVDHTWRNFDYRLGSSTFRSVFPADQRGKELLDLTVVDPRVPIRMAHHDEHHYDLPMLTCIAYIFATQAVRRAMLVVPSGISKALVISHLKSLGVPARELLKGRDVNRRLRQHLEPSTATTAAAVDSEEQHDTTSADEDVGEDGEIMYVVDAHMVRGVDVPGGVSHVFVHGLGAVMDAAAYIHIAGRVARLGSQSLDGELAHKRPPGKVITLLRGVNVREAKQNLKALRLEDAKRQRAASKQQNEKDDDDEADATADKNDVLRGIITGGVFNAPPSFTADKPASLPQRTYSTEELKMALIYQHLSVHPRKVKPLGDYTGTEQWHAQDALSDDDVRRDAEEKEQERRAMAAISEQFGLDDDNGEVWKHPGRRIEVPPKQRKDSRVLN